MTIPQTIRWIEQTETPVWNPIQEGDTIIGKILELKQTENGTMYRVLGDYTNENSEVISGEVWTPTHKALVGLMKKANAGNYCRIIYKGEKPTKHPNKLQLYTVAIGYE